MSDKRLSATRDSPLADEARDRCANCGLEFVDLQTVQEIERKLRTPPSAVIETMVNHDREPHCIGCWVVRAGGAEQLAAVCNECGETRDLTALLTRSAEQAIEPVAWRYKPSEKVKQWCYTDHPPRFVGEGEIVEPLYAAPHRVAGQTTGLPDEPGNPEPGGAAAAPSSATKESGNG